MNKALQTGLFVVGGLIFVNVVVGTTVFVVDKIRARKPSEQQEVEVNDENGKRWNEMVKNLKTKKKA